MAEVHRLVVATDCAAHRVVAVHHHRVVAVHQHRVVADRHRPVEHHHCRSSDHVPPSAAASLHLGFAWSDGTTDPPNTVFSIGFVRVEASQSNCKLERIDHCQGDTLGNPRPMHLVPSKLKILPCTLDTLELDLLLVLQRLNAV